MTDQAHPAHAEAPHREAIPVVLLRAMLLLALSSLALVTYARVTDRPLVGTPDPAPVVATTQLILDGNRLGDVTVRTADGTLIADHNATEAGFISVIWRALARERQIHKVEGNPPVQIQKLANGRMALNDPASGWHVELGFFGDQNAARFEELLDN